MERVHIDFAEKDGQNFLIVVDAHSKWPEVFPMTSTTSTKLCDKLRMWFAAYGLPKCIVSDNGPQLVSAEFENFLRNNGVKHVTSPPYHPASNGAAERMVQSVKKSLETSLMEDNGLTLSHRIANFLFMYRNTPHTTTGHTPAELFLKRQPRTRLSMVKPCLASKVKMKQSQMKVSHDGKRDKTRSFEPGDVVMVRNFRGSQRWKAGHVMQRLGPLSYMVKVQDQLRHVHIDHLLSGSVHGNNGTEEAHADIDIHVPVNPPPVPQEVPAIPPVPNVQNVVPPPRRNPPRHCGAPVKLDL